ncbi:MAG: hypothetical protein Q9N34_01715 [Aquificota bacterium]|nr:hypothetical protein [Aquificota bacterium]
MLETLRSEGVIFCSVSFPGFPEDLVETGNSVYVRFHGRVQIQILQGRA